MIPAPAGGRPARLDHDEPVRRLAAGRVVANAEGLAALDARLLDRDEHRRHRQA